MRRLLLIPLAALLTLAACGDDDDTTTVAVSEELQPYADALSSSLTADEIADDFTFTEENGDCVGATTANIAGLERLEAVGSPAEVEAATTDDFAALGLDTAELEQVSAGFLDCVDDSERLLEESFLASADLTEEQSECIAEVVDRELLIRILSAGLAGEANEAALAEVQAEFQVCA